LLLPLQRRLTAGTIIRIVDNVTVTALLSLRFILAAIATLLAVISFLSLALTAPTLLPTAFSS
jgi:hypothetical protein